MLLLLVSALGIPNYKAFIASGLDRKGVFWREPLQKNNVIITVILYLLAVA
jgi:hypothetical protein